MEASSKPPLNSRAKIYVVGELRHLNHLRGGTSTWWCAGRRCTPGDIGVIYWKEHGVTGVFRFLEFFSEKKYCQSFGMATGSVQFLTVFAKPLPASALRSHAELRNLRAVRRNFQARWFEIEEDLIDVLMEFLRRASSGA